MKRNKTTRSLVDRSKISYYGVVSAMYDNRYVLNANIRFDGSNLFGSNPKYRYLPLWSVSGRWIISNESFLSDNEMIDNLALRASYGLRGNIVEDSSPSIIAAALPPNAVTGLFEMEIQQAPNPDLKWETTTEVNFGLDFGFFRNRINGSVDVFFKEVKDLLSWRSLPHTAVTTGIWSNIGKTKSTGFELTLNTVNLEGPLRWESTLTYTSYRDRWKERDPKVILAP